MSDDDEEFTFEGGEDIPHPDRAPKSSCGNDYDDEPIARLKKRKSAATKFAMEDDEEEPSRKKKKKKKKRKKTIPVKMEDDEEEEEEEPLPKKKKKDAPQKKVKVDAAKKKKRNDTLVPDAVVSSSAPSSQGKLKQLDKTERLQYAMQSFLWWNAPEPRPGCQWTTMEHAGVAFPEPYQPHSIPLLYKNQPVVLTPAQEEAATLFAAMDPDGMHLGNPKTVPIFIQNFFADFQLLLGKKHVIQKFEHCNFDAIRQHLQTKKMINKAATDAERLAAKEGRSDALHRFGYAMVDGHLERVGNFNMEPPGTFRGRGIHPKMGRLKARVLPEQVSINVSECAPVPRCSVPGHAWADVRHDPAGQWLATWKENINNQVRGGFAGISVVVVFCYEASFSLQFVIGQSKYMQLAAQSSFKGKSDRSKYNKAALLCMNIVKIRQSYKKDLKSKDDLTRQLATAVWVIDRLALRVGGEKDTDEEADTVGCCSLRVEHLHIDPNQEGGNNREIELEFLGKDSMLYKQTIDFGAALYNDDNGMGTQVYDNFKAFCKKKKSSDQVFQDLNPTILNNHLKQFMDGLSAKVFRTYNASKTLQDELRKQEALTAWTSLSVTEKVTEYNSANREVAILCNHQRSVSKAQETQLENIGAKLETLKKQKKQLKGILKKLVDGDTSGIPVRKSYETMQEEVDQALAEATRAKETAQTTEEKIAATEADAAAKALKRNLAQAKFEKAHLWEKVPSSDQVSKKIGLWTKKIQKLELDLKHKDDNKEVSLGTSKINYMDPRISVAWCKRNEMPIEKIFSKTLRDKFNWAMAVEPQWEFHESIADAES
jgi:DNA topoisomerase I